MDELVSGPLAQRAQELAEFAMEAHREAIAERPHYVAWIVRNGSAAPLGAPSARVTGDAGVTGKATRIDGRGETR
ncbi:hypothetical protein ABZV14_33130 [Streptosporangium canum]|uniref:hypothetical protein n=1 Tax=Streptosporangium canum TaxID=324952 RepID=UPI0033ADA3AA